MRLSRLSVLSLAVLGALALSAGAAPVSPDTKDKMEPPAQKLRKGLDQVKEFDIDKQGFSKALEMLREQSGLPIESHPNDLFGGLAGLVPGGFPAGNPMVGGTDYPELTIKGKMKVRTALRRVLEPHGMTFVILDDKVYLTSTETAPHHQVRQKVNVSLDNVKLSAALKQLARETAANVVLDPKAAKQGDPELNVEMDEVNLDAAVKVLAASAGLSSVRLGNVLYVTTGARAKELRAEASDLQLPTPPMQQWMNGCMFGFAGGVGAFGIGGGGLGGLGNLGGQFGLMGAGPGAAEGKPGADPDKPADNKEEKKEPKKDEPKKDEPKKDDGTASLAPDRTTGMMAAATAGVLLFTGIGAWRRRCRRETDPVS